MTRTKIIKQLMMKIRGLSNKMINKKIMIIKIKVKINNSLRTIQASNKSNKKAIVHKMNNQIMINRIISNRNLKFLTKKIQVILWEIRMKRKSIKYRKTNMKQNNS